MIAIVDYDAGNLKSVEKALVHLGEECITTRVPEEIYNADKVILPGVGAFGTAMEKLANYGLIEVLRKTASDNKPFFGICLGLQLMFEASSEMPGTEGLGILKGKIHAIPPKESYKIPHMGWNSISVKKGSRLFKDIPDNSYVYFVHSYYLKADFEEDVAATTEYITHIHAAAEHGNIFACQFHPEKSGNTGLQILKNFCDL